MAEAATAAARRWRNIDELAHLVGAYCWVEERIFQLAGAWASCSSEGASSPSAPEVRVWCAAVSRRHGELAGRWAERLPVRAGVDPAAFVRAPAGPLETALDALAAEGDTVVAAAALVDGTLARLGLVYEAHLRTASPVSEAPVMAVLVGARRQLAGEIRGGRAFVGAFSQARDRGDQISGSLERAFAATDVFPAVRTS